MSENITLDRIDFEKITQQAKAARAVYLRRYKAAVVVAVGSTFAVALILGLLYGPRTNSDQLASTVQTETVATQSGIGDAFLAQNNARGRTLHQ